MKKYTGSDYLTTVQVFSDSKCSVIQSTSITAGNYSIGAASKDVSGAYDFDATETAVKITLAKAELVDFFIKSVQGQSNHDCRAIAQTIKVNESIDVTPCAHLSKTFSIVKMQSNQFLLGGCTTASGSFSSATTRPTFLDSQAYIRMK